MNDKKKPFRKNTSNGMGTRRYFCVPKNMIGIRNLPSGWGLLYVDEKMNITKIHDSSIFEKNLNAEHELMYSALRRLHIKGFVDKIYKS